MVTLGACSSGGSKRGDPRLPGRRRRPRSGAVDRSRWSLWRLVRHTADDGERTAGQSTLVSDARFVTALGVGARRSPLLRRARGQRSRSVTGSSVKEFATVPPSVRGRNGSYSERGLLGPGAEPQLRHRPFRLRLLLTERLHDAGGGALHRLRRRCDATRRRWSRCRPGDDCCHKGGRLAFGTDGKLYVTLGDEHSVTKDTVGSTSSVPQDTSDVRGKILRYEPDGSIPSDNPFGARQPGMGGRVAEPVRHRVRHRRRRARSSRRTVRPATSARRTLATTSRSASKPGGRYQWPACYGYSHLVPGATTCLGLPEPEWSSEAVDDRANRRNVGRRQRS